MNNFWKKNIGSRIKAIREYFSLNQTDFSEILNINQNYLSRYENGIHEFTDDLKLKLIDSIAKKYKKRINLHWLISEKGEMFLPESDKKAQNQYQIPKLEVAIDERLKNIEIQIAEIRNCFKETNKVFQDSAMYTNDPNSDPNRFVSEPEPDYCNIPFMENVAAGPPITQSEDLSDYIKVPLKFLKKKKVKSEECYAVRVVGESMTETIPDGSIVLIKKSDTPKNGIIQVVRHGRSSTLKRMKEHEDHRWTAEYEDGSGRCIELGPDEDYQIQGDFVAVLPEEGK